MDDPFTTDYYHAAFELHDIMNPLSEDTLMLIGKHCLHEKRNVILDIGSGKGFVSFFFAKTFGTYCVQVDSSPKWTAIADKLFTENELRPDTEIHLMDCNSFEIESEKYDMILCLGTTAIFGGFNHALKVLKQGLGKDGILVVGETSYDRALPKLYSDFLHRQGWLIHNSQQLLTMIEHHDMEILFTFRSTSYEWDKYMSLQWKAISDFARNNPNRELAEEFLSWARDEQEVYLRFQRACIDWNVFVLRQLA